MALPRDPGGARQHPEQDAAVDQQDDDADDDLPDLAGEEPEHDQEREPPEDEAGGADVVGLAPHADVGAVRADIAEQPGSEAAENPHDGGGEDEPRQARKGHQEAEYERRNGVGDQVIPVRVQQRRPDDAPQTVGLQRPNAVVVQAMIGQRVPEFDDPQQDDETDDRHAADNPRGPLLRLRRRARHPRVPRSYAHSCPSNASSASSRLPAYAPVDRYFQPASATTNAMSACSPAFNALAAMPSAACSTAPVEIPAKMPSTWTSSRVRLTAS